MVFVVFFGRIKCIRLFRYNSHIYLFIYFNSSSLSKRII